jgi:cytochrome b6-f complex iron-sulfur subunit
MPTRTLVTRVWIDPGCIVCDACQTTAPTVFQVTEDTCVILPEALDPAFTRPLTDAIFDAAEECPVNVIKYQVETVEEPAPDKDSSSTDSSRRTMLVGSIAVGAGWLALGTAGVLSSGPVLARFMMPNGWEDPDPRVRIGPLRTFADMSPGQVNEDFKPQGVVIVRLSDSIAAVSPVCTHLGCVVNWLPDDRRFRCPCHGSGFSHDGINRDGPAPRPLERFAIAIEDGTLVVDKSRRFLSERGQWNQPASYIAL